MNSKPDKLFDDPILASIYDDFDDDRSDLLPYVAMAKEFGAKSIADLGCSTGVLALLLAKEGYLVIGVDPAEGSIRVAKTKPCAEQVTWINGYSNTLPNESLDMVFMTGNTAQAIVDASLWSRTLKDIYSALNAGGHFIFEIRKATYQAWKQWNKECSYKYVDIPGKGRVESWEDLLAVELPYVSFRRFYLFQESGKLLTSDSKIIFRSQQEITDNLSVAGFTLEDIREAPDRLDKEMVFIARKPVR